MGFLKTMAHVSQEVYWLGMRKSVRRCCVDCAVCQQAKHLSLAPIGLLQPLSILKRVWEDVSMDFVEGLPRSEGYNSILVVVDRLSKYSHFLPLKHPFMAVSVAQVFIREVGRLHDTPRRSCLIGIKFSPACFGKNSSVVWGQHCVEARHITPKRMAKPRWSIDALKSIFVALL